MIKYCFGSTGRRITKILRDVPKDFTMNIMVQQQYKEMKNEDLKANEVPISEAFKRTSNKLTHFQKPPAHKMNRYLKDKYNTMIQYGIDDETKKLRNEIEDKTLKWQENRLMAEEANKFKKVVFKKNESLRLIKAEENRVQNYLPLNPIETEYGNLKEMHGKYEKNLSQLHNQRMNNFIHNKPEEAYNFLVKSQLLSQYPQVRELIAKQMEILNKSSNNIIVYDGQIIDDFVNQVKQFVNESESIIDWESVTVFYQKLVQQQGKSMEQLNTHQQKVTEIQEYSNQLFDKFYNQQLSLRIKGRFTFSDMTDEEIVRYVKFDVKQPEIALRLITSVPQLNSSVVSSLMQKLGTISFKNKLNYIGLISDWRFRKLLQNIAVAQFDDNNLCQTILALSQVRPKTISQLYSKLSYHLYHNLSKQFTQRIHKLTNSQLAMAVRNIQMLPIYKNSELQDLITDEIKKRQNLDVYQAESYLRFLSRSKDEYKIELLKTIFKNDYENTKVLDIDKTTLMIIGQSLIKSIKSITQASEIKQCLNQNIQTLQQVITECQTSQLAPFVLLLSQVGFHKNNELVRMCKKRFIDIISQRQQIQDESDIAGMVSSLMRIDCQLMYSNDYKVNEVILLNSVFNRIPYRQKSPFHIPYSKLLEIIGRYKDKFQEQNIIIILHSLICLGHINAAIFKELLNQIKDTQYLFPVYIQFQTIDSLFEQLIYKYNKQEEITQLGRVYYIQSLFYLNSKLLKQELFDQIEWKKLDKTTKCYLAMIYSKFGKSEYVPLPDSVEQKYLLKLAGIEVDISQNELNYLLKQQREISDSRNKEMGIERYTPEQIRQQVFTQLQQMQYSIRRNHIINDLCLADIYLDEKKLGLHFLSVNELLSVKDTFTYNGVQKLIQQRSGVKYVIYEEWVRCVDKNEYLLQIIN